MDERHFHHGEPPAAAQPATAAECRVKLARAFAMEYFTGHDRPLIDGEQKRFDQLVTVMLAYGAQAFMQVASATAQLVKKDDLAWRLGCMAEAVLSAKVGPQARFFTRQTVDEIVLLLREAEKRIVEGR